MWKRRFSGSNAVRAASHVLSRGEGEPEARAERLLALYDAFKERGRRYGRYYELPILAALSVLDVEPAAAADDALEVDAALASLKGYRGVFGVDKKTRLSHAVMLTADGRCPQPMEAAALAGTVAMLAAQQAAMCAVVCCSSTAASSAAH